VPRDAIRPALVAFGLSRVLVFVVAVFAATTVDPASSGMAAGNDVPVLTHPFGASGAGRVADHLITPLARWDSVWYLDIAKSGYQGSEPGTSILAPERRAGFFPAYPALTRALAGFSGSPGALLVAAVVGSLLAFMAALLFLYRLAELDVGAGAARAAVLLLAFSPMSLFFSAPYSESLFLALSVGCIYAARSERWALAGVLAALASATRFVGLLLIVPLALMFLYGPRSATPSPSARRLAPRYPLRPQAAWLLLAPAGLVAFSWHLHRALGDGLAWTHAQKTFGNKAAGPIAGISDLLTNAWNALGDLASGSAALPGRGLNLLALVVLVVASAAAVGVFRRLGVAYGTYALLGILVPLSSRANPLPSLPRYVTPLFPLFIWLGVVCERRGVTDQVLACFAILLGLFTAQFATWQYIG
jgi:hypothetical protein